MFFKAIEKRAGVEAKGSLSIYDDFWFGLGGSGAVTTTTAMQLWAVNSCITLISSAIAQLPLKLKQTVSTGGTIDAITHPLYDLCKLKPNPDMSSFNWREACQGNLLAGGNTYSWIERSTNNIKAIWPIEPKYVTPKFATAKERQELKIIDGSRIVYHINLGDGKKWVAPARDILHVVGFGFNGLFGESVITNYAKQSIQNGQALDKFQETFFKNGIQTSGVFEHPQSLGENSDSFLSALREKYSGGDNAGIPMVLEDGMKFTQNKISLVDQQYLEQAKANALQICAIYHVPPSKLSMQGVGTSYNSTEMENKNYVDDTLMQWLVRWEQELDISLLSEAERRAGYFFKFNLDALLRPDAKTRAEIGQIEWQQGTPLNVIRARDDLNPIEGGDKSYVPMNFIEVGAERDEPVEPRSSCGCGLEHRQSKHNESNDIEQRQAQVVQGRDRISEAWRPLIRRAAQRVIRLEVRAVQREANYYINGKQRDETFYQWAERFYKNFNVTIENELGSVIREYQKQMSEVVSREIGADEQPGFMTTLSTNYINGMAKVWINRSMGQIVNLLNIDKTDDDLIEPDVFDVVPYQEIYKRADKWNTKRADRVEQEQTLAAGNAVVYGVLGESGAGLVWHTREGEDNPYCQSMRGKTIYKGESFASAGEEIEIVGEKSLEIKRKISYPPLFEGCTCTIIPG